MNESTNCREQSPGGEAPLLGRGCCSTVRASKTPLLGKGGVDATIKKNIAKHPNPGADGVVRSTSDYRWLIEPPRLRASKVASQYFIDALSHPSFAKEGSFAYPHGRATAPTSAANRMSPFHGGGIKLRHD